MNTQTHKGPEVTAMLTYTSKEKQGHIFDK